MDKCIDPLAKATCFSTSDANSGYWQVEIDGRENRKTTFKSHHGLYRFVRMPLDLNNESGTFQRVVDVILATDKWQYATVYLYEVIIFSKTAFEHLEHVRSVLRLLSEAGVTLKLKKCHLFTDTVDYLGHVIIFVTLEVASHTTAAIDGLKHPTTVTDLRYFL